MNDSSDDGLCDGDSSSKKVIRIWNFRNARRCFWKVQKKFKCGCCDRELWGAVFYNKNVTNHNKICYKHNRFVIGKTMVRQWENNGWTVFFRLGRSLQYPLITSKALKFKYMNKKVSNTEELTNKLASWASCKCGTFG